MRKMRLLAMSMTGCILFGGVAFANSAQTHFRGISSTGAIFTGDQSPIVVEKERLTFDLQEFPKGYYAEREDYLAYSGKVTAEYTFHNPAEYDVTVTLAFPFGRMPDYGYDHDTKTGQPVYVADAEKYDVTVDGVPIEKNVRHTFSQRGEEFVLEKDLSRLTEGDLIDDFWRSDLPVTKYSWKVDGIVSEEDVPEEWIGFIWKDDGGKRKLLLPNDCGVEFMEDNSVAVTRWVENGQTVEFYVFGAPLAEKPDWYTENEDSEKVPIACTLTPLPTETMTYKEFALAEYQEDSGISSADWYKAMTKCLEVHEWQSGILANFEYGDLNPSRDLMRWYVYDITVPAGETVVNTVTAPMYPDMDTSYDPPVYAYTYLLSPAKSWADFGSLDIVINTPYFLTEKGGLPFEQTENGYTCSLDGLPDGELSFILSADAHPWKAPFWQRGAFLWRMGAIAAGLLLCSILRKKWAANKRK